MNTAQRPLSERRASRVRRRPPRAATATALATVRDLAPRGRQLPALQASTRVVALPLSWAELPGRRRQPACTDAAHHQPGLVRAELEPGAQRSDRELARCPIEGGARTGARSFPGHDGWAAGDHDGRASGRTADVGLALSPKRWQLSPIRSALPSIPAFLLGSASGGTPGYGTHKLYQAYSLT